MRYGAYDAGDGGPSHQPISPPMPVGKPPTEVLLDVFWSAAIPGTSTGGFAPAQMEVISASSARGDLPARVCLLGADMMAYRVFTLPLEAEMLRP